MAQYSGRLLMDKYIGFDIDSKKVSVCVVESGKKDMPFYADFKKWSMGCLVGVSSELVI